MRLLPLYCALVLMASACSPFPSSGTESTPPSNPHQNAQLTSSPSNPRVDFLQPYEHSITIFVSANSTTPLSGFDINVYQMDLLGDDVLVTTLDIIWSEIHFDPKTSSGFAETNVGDLKGSATYTFNVIAHNNYGASPLSSRSIPVTTTGLRLSPTTPSTPLT
jgi:hypothetical protein